MFGSWVTFHFWRERQWYPQNFPYHPGIPVPTPLVSNSSAAKPCQYLGKLKQEPIFCSRKVDRLFSKAKPRAGKSIRGFMREETVPDLLRKSGLDAVLLDTRQQLHIERVDKVIHRRPRQNHGTRSCFPLAGHMMMGTEEN